ncbi:hypothetical protein INT47_002131 [Mucor saturninus]|uniref:PIPK domain-containing protein n=1 Tax=Mucor saturninus TaxID=64648 RepID=A0A8H7R1P2_9FUNG|nr:hypothetical protein INT47_002131 [Mucor saturninus]
MADIVPIEAPNLDEKLRILKPLPMPKIPSSLDDSSRLYVLKLLSHWLNDLDIPLYPWCEVLLQICCTLYEKATVITSTKERNAICLQTFTTNSPMESNFLPNVYHGKNVSTVEFSLEFPIGGTIRIYGSNNETTELKLFELVQMLVYLTHSLYLESYVMQDSHVKLITTPSIIQEKAAIKHVSVDDSSHGVTKRSSGLFSWFRKLTPHHPSALLDEKSTSVLKRGLSLTQINRRNQLPPVTPIREFEKVIKQDDPHRFSKLKQRIQHACISTSPDCHFPYPALLNRLQIEEDLIQEQKKIILNDSKPQTRPSSQRRRSSLMSTFSSPKRNSFIVTDLQLPQSSTAYSSIRTPGLLAESRKGLDHLMLDTTSLYSFKHHQSITLGYSVYPVGCPDRPCLGPIMSKIDYFRYHAPDDTTGIFPNIDQTLGQMIRHWAKSSQSSCQAHMDQQTQFIPGIKVETPLPINRPDLETPKNSESSLTTLGTLPKRQCGKFNGCNQTLVNHVHSFSHGIGKINVYLSVSPNTAMHDTKITSWISCVICDMSTIPTVQNENTDAYSFAKYLELVFYCSKFSTIEGLCKHVKDKNAINRCFHFNGVTFKINYEDTAYYELRIPRIQMATEDSAMDSYLAPRIDLLTLKDWKSKSAIQDVDLFFQSVRTHLNLLSQYTEAEGRRKIRGLINDVTGAKKCQAELNCLDGEIKALGKRLDSDHHGLLEILKDTNVNELNDFRRHFAIQSESIIQYLTEWQHAKCNEVTDTIGWDAPDYISTKTVHCFPGSSVLVRENEPTSIIAYTLSSNEYVQEILHDHENSYNEKLDNKNLSMFSSSSTESSANEKHESVSHNDKKLIDGYYSMIERKYISPSTGASTETASFRTMVTEVVKSSVAEAHISNSKRLEELKARWLPWSNPQQGDLKRQNLTERTFKPLFALQQKEETKEVKVASYFYEKNNSQIDISPHIKHKFVHDGVEFTCIVYYAREFEMLRKRCDINQLIIQSLCRCQSWTASGGKSKSHFYKTQDDRLVIKEMVNAWNVAEKDAFLKFAPKYFDHMKMSANDPSVLAKIFGFFTIRMKNTLDKKTPVFNLDVMVMEHLFYNQNIVHRFDFKGIQDRHVEEFRKQQQDTTLWDGDWIQDYRTKLSVHEQSKAILELAVEKDTEFLSKSNIMDYSLLVGIDKDKHEMTVGIVDFIGTYTWYKKLESKSKSTLQFRKEVTVVPPEQYKLRFCREVSDYFVPVPD